MPAAQHDGGFRTPVGRSLATITVVAALTAAVIAGLPSRRALASSVFVPSGDTDVSSGSPTKNYGTATTLRVKLASSGSTYRTLLRFDLADLGGTVTRLQLRLFVTDSSTSGGKVYQIGTSWTETGVTWKTQPTTIGAALASLPAVTSSTWVSVDLPTSLVAGSGSLGLAIYGTTSNQAAFSSRQGSNPPQLVETLLVAPSPTASPSPTPTPTPPPPPGPTATPLPTPTAAPTPPDTPTPTASPTDIPTPDPAPSPPGDPVVIAAGDIACSPLNGAFNNGDGTATACRQLATSDLALSAAPVAVLALGDLQYFDGALADFLASYDVSWGRVKSITHPAVGNHEYQTSGATGYYTYFGSAAGSSTQGWYSFDIGSWHLIAINSNCSKIGGCGAGSPQETWLAQDLAAHHQQCTLAYWHHPRYSSGEHGSDREMQPIWQDLADAGAALVLSGHDHGYERFGPQDAYGTTDPRGVRQFVVGTGGASHYNTWTMQPNSETHNGDTFGVLKLTLHATTYDWQFVSAAGSTFSDAGAGSCPATTTSSDVTPPTTPDGVVGSALDEQTVRVDWNPSSDDTGVAMYEVRRDGVTLGTVAGATTYLDTTAPSGVTMTYAIRARDAAGNWSGLSQPAAVTTPSSTALLFADDFESGALGAWTSTANAATATGDTHGGAWALRVAAATTTAPASYVSKTLPASQAELYCRTWLKIESQGSSALDLLKLRDAAGTAIAYVLRTSSGQLAFRNNVAGITTTSTTALASSSWHEVEVRVRSGSGGSSDVWLDGTLVSGLSLSGNYGTTGLGRIEIGESAGSRTYSVLFDDVGCSVSSIP